MLDYTIHVSDSLHMQVDMVLGTGWPYGGSHVTPEYAATKLIIEKYPLKKNETIDRVIKLENSKEKIQPHFYMLWLMEMTALTSISRIN